MEFDFNELRELLSVLNQTDVTELILKINDFELTLRKGTGTVDRSASLETGVSPAIAIPSVQPLASAPPPSVVVPMPTVNESNASASSVPAPLANERLTEITSPMVGTFYRAPAPDEPPFVEVGDRIRSGQTVCIIEAMKLMNELEAEVSGEIVEILVDNGEPVEYGQVLMRVKPA